MSGKRPQTLDNAGLAAIVESAMDAVVAIDGEQRIVLFNAAAEQMFGCPAADALGSSVERFLPERFREEHRDHVRSFARTGVTTRRMGALAKIYGLRSDGEEFPIDAAICQSQTRGGRIFTVFLRDVTERERDQAALRRRQDYLQSVLDTVNAVVVLLAPDGTVLDWNRRAESLFGVVREEAVGDSYTDFLPDDERERVFADLDRVCRNGTATEGFENAVETAQGPRQVLWHATRVADEEGSPAVLATGFDLTERKRAHAVAEHLAAIVHSCDDAIIGKTLDGEILSWNRAAEVIYGYSASEAIGRSIAMILPDDRKDESDRFSARLRAGQRVDHFDTVRVRKDGKPIEVSLSVSPIHNANGDIVGAATVARDMTEQRAAARRERETELRLRQLEALASISTLTAGIAHDIGAPMTAILGYAEMMQKSLADANNRRRAGIIVEQVQRVSELVQALLSMARPGERRLIPVDLARVVRASLEFYREKLRMRGITVETSLAPAPPIVGDADRLQQVFLNVIINAADAMADGGTLSVSLSSLDEATAEVRIGDTGAGIASEALGQIFEPFYTTKKRGQGTGLGLVVAKGIIDDHDGRISVVSELGAGTEFAIRFPAAN